MGALIFEGRVPVRIWTITGVSVAIVSLVLQTAAHANEQRQFNLLCHGIEKYVAIHDFPKRRVEQLYRIDLNKNLWCSARCERTETIGSVDDLHIVLSSVEEAGLRNRVVVDRLDQHIDYSTGSGYGSNFRGLTGHVNCSVLPFTSFPPPLF